MNCRIALLPKNHAMNAYRGHGGKAPLILYLNMTWR